MALTATQINQVFEIFEIPLNGVLSNFTMVSSPFGAAGDDQDASAAVTHLNARLTELTAEQITRCGTLLSRWATMTTNPAKIYDKAGSLIADYTKERANIRAALSSIIGIRTPINGGNNHTLGR